MSKGAKLLEIIYADTQETAAVMVTIGDTVRAQDWARENYPNDLELQEQRAGLYAVYLGARRQNLPGASGEWLEWLDMVTIPDDEEEAEEDSTPGECAAPPSES